MRGNRGLPPRDERPPADGTDRPLRAGALSAFAGVLGEILGSASRRTYDDPPLRADGGIRMPIEELATDEELRLMARAMEEAPVGITISDAEQLDNPLIYLNDEFASLTGYPKEETVGRNCRFLQGEQSDPEVIARMREAIDRAEPVSVELINYRKDGTRFWNRVDIAPVLDDHGEPANFVGFQTDITERKEAERALEREREQLERLLDRISGLLQDVHGDLVRAVSREEVEASVCRRIAAAEGYAFCWLGEPDMARDVLVADTWSGGWEPATSTLELSLEDTPEAVQPFVDAYETGELRLVTAPEELEALRSLHEWMRDDVTGIAAIPLTYRDTSYGVLAVYADQIESLNHREVVVLEALGRATATAINAHERGRILISDEVIELEFELRDRSIFFVDLAARAGVNVAYNGAIYRETGALLMFFTADVEPDLVEEVVDDHPEIQAVVLVNEGDDGNLFEFAVGDGSIVTSLAERGARVRSIQADDGSAEVTIELARDTEARSIVEHLEERHPGTELVAYRERRRPPETKQEFVGEVRDSLTERQLTALQTAYVSGYYEPNRRISGDDLAASMGVARSTFHQHLRSAERKVIGRIFELR